MNRPTSTEWRAFVAPALHASGLGALGAGLIFFVAANWQAWGLYGRFALLQAGILICVVIALWRPPPQRSGEGALLLATLLTGGALALFGQSYQTGADVYELFFTWALLALPFALAAVSGAVWGVWWTVLAVALALMCGTLSLDHLLWRLLDGRHVGRAALLMLPCLVNLLGAGAFLALRRTRWQAAAPLWLLRNLTTLGLGFGTVASLPLVGRETGVLVLYGVLSIGIAFATWARKQDVFALTALAGSWIVISTAWLVHSLRLNDLGELFTVALWLIASSTIAGMALMRWFRQWRAASPAGVVHE